MEEPPHFNSRIQNSTRLVILYSSTNCVIEHCTLTVPKSHNLLFKASDISATDSFSWGHDPATQLHRARLLTFVGDLV